MDASDQTYYNKAIAFNDNEGNIYSIYVASLNEFESNEIMQTLLDSFKYHFEVLQKYYKLKLKVAFEGDDMSDQRSIDVFVDDDNFGNVVQGNVFEKDIDLEEGSHLITFYKSENYDIYRSTEINMDSDKAFSCSVESHEEDLEIKDQLEEQISKEPFVENINEQDKTEEPVEEQSPDNDLILTVDYESNLFLNKYDVDIYANDQKIGSVSQGDKFNKTVTLKAGQYSLVFCKKGDKKVYGKASVDMSEGQIYSCSIVAHRKEIEISKVKTETIAERDKRIAEAEAKKKAEEERKEAQKKAEEEAEKQKAELENRIYKCVRRKIVSAEKVAAKYGYSVKLLNLHGKTFTAKYNKLNDTEQKEYRIQKVGAINHDKKSVDLTVGNVVKLKKIEKSQFSDLKKESLTDAYKQAKEDGYALIVKNRNGERVDNKSGFKKSKYVFLSVSDIKYDKAKIVVKADTKKHIEHLEAVKRAKAEAAAKRKAEEAARKKKEAERKRKEKEKREYMNEIVYVAGGECYHREYCRTLSRSRNVSAVTRQYAKNVLGRRECNVCFPG